MAINGGATQKAPVRDEHGCWGEGVSRRSWSAARIAQ